MSELRKIRRFESTLVGGAFILYLTRRLLQEYFSYASLLAMAQRVGYRPFDTYSFPLHVVFPILAGGVLLLAGWYVFHYLAYPQLKTGKWERKVWVYLGLVMFLVAAGVTIFYYFRLYAQVMIEHNVIVNVHTYSIFSIRTVLSDAAGMLIVFYLYQLCAQVVYYLYGEYTRERESSFRYLGYLLLAGITAFFLTFALFGHWPTPLWQAPYFLLISGSAALVHIGQSFLYTHLFPYIGQHRYRPFVRNLLLFLGIHLAGTLLIWGTYSNGQWFSPEPIAVIFILTLFAAAVVGYTRQSFVQEKNLLKKQVSSQSAELSGLRSQINPHFLFNALNTLYASSLVEKAERTADGIQKLGDMMRFMFQENNQQRIPLHKEVEYLHNYIAIQRMRIDPTQDVEIRVSIQGPDQELYIAPMLLIPFVENAFK